MLRKDVTVAWNLLHILTDDYVKVYSLSMDIFDKWDIKVSEHYLRKIVAELAHNGLVETKRGVGVRRSLKTLIYMDEVFDALGLKWYYSTNNPAGRLQNRIKDMIKRVDFVNDKIFKEK